MLFEQLHNEAGLLLRMAQGDAEAMRSIFNVYYPRLCFFAESIIGDREQAKDIAQEALLQLWRQRAQFADQQKSNLEAYLFTVVRRDCYDYHKHQRVKHDKESLIAARIPVTGEAADAALVYIEVLQKVYKEIQRLPPHLATIVTLSFIEGLTTQEIADRLQMTPNHVRVQKSRALDKLKTALLKQQLLITILLFFFLFAIFLEKL